MRIYLKKIESRRLKFLPKATLSTVPSMYSAVKMRYSNHSHWKKAMKQLLDLPELAFTIYKPESGTRKFYKRKFEKQDLLKS